jgi:predicted nucleotidyltransferase component of viral defense system
VSTNTPTNLAASVRARLKNKADELGLEFGQVLQYFVMERFLYRLSKTKWADCLIVKGAALLRVWDGGVARPTKDIDFLGRLDNSPDAVSEMVRDCLAVDAADGIEFSQDLSVEQITVEDRYPGIRAVIRATISGARMRLQLDIGVADVAVPEPGWVMYPTLLDMEAPHILAYQPATAVAEKFETMVSKGLLNSRVKDYYDIWTLANTVTFKGEDLRDSIAATFAQRGTLVPASRPTVLASDYSMQPTSQAQWSAFAKRMQAADVETSGSLTDVVDAIDAFVMPAAAAAAKGQPFDCIWTPGEGWS